MRLNVSGETWRHFLRNDGQKRRINIKCPELSREGVPCVIRKLIGLCYNVD